MRFFCKLAALAGASACSNVQLPNDDFASISARTMDLGFWNDFSLEAVPAGHIFHMNSTKPAPAVAKYGYLSIFPSVESVATPMGPARMVVAGLNTEGMSCDMQTLVGTAYPRFPAAGSASFDVLVLCEWALASFANAGEAAAALQPGGDDGRAPPAFVAMGPDFLGFHFVLRDAFGPSVVLEFLDGETHVTFDDASGSSGGVGVFTNEPPFPWHVANVEHLEWKRSLARPAVAIPGGFYPDERFLRLHLLRQGLPAPSSYRAKVAQALHLLDAVTVPPGKQPATDSGKGEGPGDHTVFGLVYDHTPGNATVRGRAHGGEGELIRAAA